MDHLQRAGGLDADTGVAAGHAGDVDVLEIGQEVLRLGGHGVVLADGTVRIGGLEDDGLALDVGHVDV